MRGPTQNYLNSLDPGVGGPPSGVAGGDLTGTYPNPSLQVSGVVAGVYGSAAQVPQITLDAKGRAIAATTVPISGGPPTGAASGDLTGLYPNPSLVSSGVAAGTYGSPAQVPQITFDAKGRATNATTVAIASGPPSGAAGGDLAGSYPNPVLAASGVTAGTYGSAALVPQITFDVKGRATAVTTVAVASGPPSGAAGGDLTGTYPNPTLGVSGAAAGTYGTGTQIPQITVDAKGRITSITTVAVSGGGGSTLVVLDTLASGDKYPVTSSSGIWYGDRTKATAGAVGSTVVGNLAAATVTGTNPTVFGYGNTTSGVNPLTLGYLCTATGDATIAGGVGAQATANNAIAFGSGTTAIGDSAAAFGAGSQAGLYCVAAGAGAIAVGATGPTVALGLAAHADDWSLGVSAPLAISVAPSFLVGSAPAGGSAGMTARMRVRLNGTNYTIGLFADQ